MAVVSGAVCCKVIGHLSSHGFQARPLRIALPIQRGHPHGARHDTLPKHSSPDRPRHATDQAACPPPRDHPAQTRALQRQRLSRVPDATEVARSRACRLCLVRETRHAINTGAAPARFGRPSTIRAISAEKGFETAERFSASNRLTTLISIANHNTPVATPRSTHSAWPAHCAICCLTKCAQVEGQEEVRNVHSLRLCVWHKIKIALLGEGRDDTTARRQLHEPRAASQSCAASQTTTFNTQRLLAYPAAAPGECFDVPRKHRFGGLSTRRRPGDRVVEHVLAR
jgi:hypothetical protein